MSECNCSCYPCWLFLPTFCFPDPFDFIFPQTTHKRGDTADAEIKFRRRCSELWKQNIYLHAAPDEYYYFRFKLLCCCFQSSAWTRKFTQSRWDFACATVFMYTREYMLYAVLPSIQADRRKPTSGVCKSRKKNRSFLFKIEKRQHGHDSVLLFQPIQLHQLRKKSLRRTLPTFLLKWKETPSDFTTGPGQLILTAVS